MFSITLTNSELSIEVSEEDYLTLVLLGPWHLAGAGSARTNTAPYEYLHRIVANRMGLASNLEVDHKDRNKLNSKRNNLQSATRSEQMVNCELQSNNTSGHKCISQSRGRWIIQIKRDGKRVYVGSATKLEEAIRVRDNYIKLHNMSFVE